MNYPNDKTVLVVVDSAERRESMRAVFEQAGFSVLAVSDGVEGFSLAAGSGADLIIGDAMTAAGGDGIELCRRIRADENLRFLPVLLVGSLRKEGGGGGVRGLEVGADDYIELPVEPLCLIARAVRLIERKRTEDAVRRSEKYFRSLIENVSDLITILSLEGTILYESPSFAQMLGYDADELIGERAFDFVHPDDAEKVFAYFQMATNSFETAVSVEFRFRHKTDGWRILESLGKLFKYRTGETVVLVTSRDITERRRAEKALRESEAQMQAVFNNSAIGISLSKIQGNSVRNNPALERMFGYTNEELRRKSFLSFTHPDDVGKTTAILEQLADGSRDYGQLEKRYIKKGGDEIWCNLTLSKIPDDGERQLVIGMIEDITERKQAERVLRESEENFRALVRATTQFVWTIRENGECAELAAWWMNLTGLGSEQVQGDGWLTAIHPDDRRIAAEIWRNAFADRILFDTSYRIRTTTGEHRHYSVRGVPVFNADGSFRQWIGTFTDITEHKRAEEALLKSEEQLRLSQRLESVGRLAGGIAHDFNNMITAINGYSELTLRKLDENSPLRRNIEEIKKAGERSALLTHQLLAFSRRQVLQSKILDLNELIADTTKMLERLIGEDVRLETILDSRLSRIKGDHGQLTQVIMNLAVNARDAMPNGGNLTIETADVFLDETFAAAHFPTKPGSYAMLSVSDDGAGIDAETQKNIFEPFYTTKEVGKGTGLGLATVYGIVKQSGGFIWLESEIGVGSTFKIYLPRADSETETRGGGAAAAGAAAKKAETILIVEDEDLVRDLMCRALEECGYKVIGTNSGNEALTVCAAAGCDVDLVITDVVMPQMGGRELAERLTESCPQIRVLFTSGYTDDEILRRDVISEAQNFIQKPFSFDALAAKVRQSLDGESKRLESIGRLVRRDA